MFTFKVALRKVKKEFLLPMKHDKLFEEIRKEKPKHASKKDIFHKTYPIKSIKDSKGKEIENIVLDKQFLSIYLFNLFLLVKRKTKQFELKEGVYSEAFILEEIEQVIGKEIKHLPFEEQESTVLSFLQGNKKDEPKKAEEPKDSKENQTEEKTESVLDKVEFSMDWVRKADAEIKRKKREKKEGK